MRGFVAGERFNDFFGLDTFKTIILHLQTFYSIEYGGMIINHLEVDGDVLFHDYFPALA